MQSPKDSNLVNLNTLFITYFCVYLCLLMFVKCGPKKHLRDPLKLSEPLRGEAMHRRNSHLWTSNGVEGCRSVLPPFSFHQLSRAGWSNSTRLKSVKVVQHSAMPQHSTQAPMIPSFSAVWKPAMSIMAVESNMLQVIHSNSISTRNQMFCHAKSDLLLNNGRKGCYRKTTLILVQVNSLSR